VSSTVEVTPEPSTIRAVVFHCMDTDDQGTNYYESIDLIDASHPQTILAYETNDRALPIEYGAPLRLRVENQLGYKHAKYIHKIEFVARVKKYLARQRRLLGRSRLRVVRGDLMTCAVVRRLSTKKFLITSRGH
jgi:DMSO/TMAO reductase YedYZ molybdopterin-dependent catalytic subunit